MTYRCAAALAIIAVCLGGCGSAGISPASYRASVNKICAAYNAKITATPASATNTISGLKEVIGEASDGLKQIKALTPPSSMRTPVGRWVGSLTQSYTDSSKAVGAIQAGNDAEAKSLATKGLTLNSTDNAEARSLGLPSCAANPQPSGN